MFKSPFLEWFTHIHPATPVILYTPAILYFLFKSFTALTLPEIVGLFALGALSWTIIEYLLHRFVFHYQPKTPFGKRIHFFTHGVHHDYPKDSTRLVMPPPFSLPLGALFIVLYYNLFGVYGFALTAGLFTGYVVYDTVHYATHHLPMKSRLGKFLKQYHMKHHYTDSDRSFGVSSPLWDFVFRTQPKSNKTS